MCLPVPLPQGKGSDLLHSASRKVQHFNPDSRKLRYLQCKWWCQCYQTRHSRPWAGLEAAKHVCPFPSPDHDCTITIPPPNPLRGGGGGTVPGAAQNHIHDFDPDFTKLCKQHRWGPVVGGQSRVPGDRNWDPHRWSGSPGRRKNLNRTCVYLRLKDPDPGPRRARGANSRRCADHQRHTTTSPPPPPTPQNLPACPHTTVMSVAQPRRLRNGTRSTAVGWVGCDGPGPRLSATVAGLSAGAPRVPIAHFTIHRRECVCTSGEGEGGSMAQCVWGGGGRGRGGIKGVSARCAGDKYNDDTCGGRKCASLTPNSRIRGI